MNFSNCEKYHIISFGIIIIYIFSSLMIKIFLLLVLGSLSRADCPLSNYPRATALGYIEAQLDNDLGAHNQETQYVQALENYLYKPNPKVAIAIIGLELNPHEQIDFKIRHIPGNEIDQIKFGVTVSDSNLGWRMLKFTFLATSSTLFNTDMIESRHFSVGTQEGSFSLYRPIVDFDNFKIKPVIRVYLSGLTLTAKPLGSKFQRINRLYQRFKKYSRNQVLISRFQEAVQLEKALKFQIRTSKVLSGLIALNFYTNADISSFSFSYILFSEIALQDKHNYVMGSFSLTSKDSYRFTGLNNMNMVLAGLTQLTTTRQEQYYFHLGLDSYFGQSYFKNQLNSHPVMELSFTYVAFEIKQQFVCEDCPNSPIIYQDNYCVEKCPRSFSKSSRLGNVYCDKCDIEKLKFVDENGQCSCAKRHYLQANEDICKACSYDCLTCSNAKTCLTCDTAQRQTHRRINRFDRCECPSAGFFDNQVAEDIVCKKCDPSCQTCRGPSARDCLTCNPDKYLDRYGHCACRYGYSLDKSGSCICQFPSFISQGYCSKSNVICGQNQIKQYLGFGKLFRCICKLGYTQILDQCIQCTGNSSFDQETLRCKCAGEAVFQNGQCVTCGSNQKYDKQTDTCQCTEQSFQTQTGQCITCPQKMAFINGECACIYNHYESSTGVCRGCKKQSDGPKCRRNIS